MKFTSTLYSTVTNGVEYTSILDTTPAFFLGTRRVPIL